MVFEIFGTDTVSRRFFSICPTFVLSFRPLFVLLLYPRTGPNNRLPFHEKSKQKKNKIKKGKKENLKQHGYRMTVSRFAHVCLDDIEYKSMWPHVVKPVQRQWDNPFGVDIDAHKHKMCCLYILLVHAPQSSIIQDVHLEHNAQKKHQCGFK